MTQPQFTLPDDDDELAESAISYASPDDPGLHKCHSGPGWYVWYAEYPDEGSLHFDHEPTDAELAELEMRRA